MLLASVFGVTDQADIAVLLLTLPDLLLKILVGGALGAALIPSFVDQPEKAKKLFMQSSIALLVLFSLISCLLTIFSEHLVLMLAPGFNAEKVYWACEMIGVALFLLPLSVLTGVSTAYLHAQNKFLLPSLGTLIFNGCLILGLGYMMYSSETSLYILLGSLVMAGVCRYASQLAVIGPKSITAAFFNENLLSRDLIIRFAQAMLSGGVLLTFPVIARAFASYQGAGSMAAFNYAMRLVELPLMLTLTFVSVVLMPRLSLAYSNDRALYRKLIVYGLQLILTLGVGVISVLVAGVVPYTDFVFGNSLSSQDLESLYGVVKIGLLTIIFQGITTFMTTVCNAEKKPHRPMYVTLAGAIFYLAVLSFYPDQLSSEVIMFCLLAAHIITAILMVIITGLDFQCYKLLSKRFVYYGTLGLVALGSYKSVILLRVIFNNSTWLIIPMLAIGVLMLSVLFFVHGDTRKLFMKKVLNRV